MNFFIVILLFSCITISTCLKCKMSPCEGILRSGAGICAEYELGQYTGMINGQGCSWDTSKVECCEKNPSAEGCKWSRTCWRLNHSHESVCKKEFGDDFKPSEKITCGAFGVSYECCPEQETDNEFDD